MATDPPRSAPSPEAVARALEARFGRPAQPAGEPVLDGLIRTILSQNTTGANAGAAFAELVDRFPSWPDVLAADDAAVAAAIRPAGLAATRSRRIRSLLQAVVAETGELSLEFLRAWDSERVRAWLTRFDGVGVKTAACVLLFALGRDEFPVDTHVLRLARRLGWVDQGAGRDQAYELLRERVPAADRHSLHVNLIRLGRGLCRPATPRCGDCPLLEVCPTGRLTTA